MNELVEKFKESIDGQPKGNKTLEEFRQALNCQPSRNTFYHGDCLFVLNYNIAPESVDLIYLDPPFYTGQVQKGKKKWQPGAMEISFDDSKKFWAEKGVSIYAPEWMKAIASKNKERAAFASYLYYMMQRLQACHKVLKKTGSIYLHCDYRASHYLKMVMDEIFGEENFLNEIIWLYKTGGVSKRYFARKHDTILLYTKSNDYVFNPQEDKSYVPTLPEPHTASGKRLGILRDEVNKYRYVVARDVWEIDSIFRNKPERVGYPTQKPEKLLERIILASSNEGDLVLDPFCGCGTAMVVAHKRNRRWIGIDISKDAYDVASQDRTRQMPLGMKEEFAKARYISRDLEEVQEMSWNDFQNWVNEYYKASRPHPDKGIDGIVTADGTPIQTKKYIIRYDVISQFLTDARYHKKVPKPIKKLIAASQAGFDDSARQSKYEIESKEGVEVCLVTPEDMLKLES